jgi:hypothetical protein
MNGDRGIVGGEQSAQGSASQTSDRTFHRHDRSWGDRENFTAPAVETTYGSNALGIGEVDVDESERLVDTEGVGEEGRE